MKIFNWFKNLSIKYQLILGLGISFCSTMIVIAINLYYQQLQLVEEHLLEENRAMTRTIASAIGGSISSRDLLGLAEILKDTAIYDETKYVFVMDNDGKILAHSDNKFVGKYVSDQESKILLSNKIIKEKLIKNTTDLIDYASPVKVNNKIVGWVRLGLDKHEAMDEAKEFVVLPLILTFVSMILGFGFIYYISFKMTRQLEDIIFVAKKIESGDTSVRAKVYSSNEVGKLSLVFNSMLDSIKKDQYEILKSQVKLKKSEERLELAMLGSRDGIWDWDLRTGEMYYSSRWLEMLGLMPSDLVPGKSEWSKRIHPEDYKVAEVALNRHLSGESPNYECEQRLMHKNGEYIWTIGRGVGVKDENGRVIRIVGTQTDISIQKNTEIEKDKIFNQLRQSQKMEAIGQLTGGIAHDFNNILAGIIGFTELGIKRSSNDEKIIGYFYHVSKLAARARDLVRQMLIYSRGGDPIPKVIEPEKVINESLHLLKPIIANELKVNFEMKNFKSKIKIDPVQLQQIVMNLAINARDAMEGKFGELKIELTEEINDSLQCSSCGAHASDKFVTISITDNANGMSAEVVKKIFEPFFTTKAPGKGTGMGLSMVHGIVHRHNGHLFVDSTPGIGTTFKIFFPIATEEVEKEVIVLPKNLKSELKSRILIVDDEEFMRSFVSDFLTEAGHVCVEAENGKIALDILNKDIKGFDLVITDFTMPEMTGIELIEQIRIDYPKLLVILSSGNIDVALDKDYKHLRIDSVLVKPYDLDEALLTIDNLLKTINKVAA